MNGLTSRQQWGLEHIVRCTCGSWLMVHDWQLHNDTPPDCPHIRAAAMEEAA